MTTKQPSNGQPFGGWLEFDLTERLNINTEGYVKQFTQLTNFNRNKLFPDNVTYSGEPDAFKKDFIVETGRAVGADVVVKYEERETYLWLFTAER